MLSALLPHGYAFHFCEEAQEVDGKRVSVAHLSPATGDGIAWLGDNADFAKDYFRNTSIDGESGMYAMLLFERNSVENVKRSLAMSKRATTIFDESVLEKLKTTCLKERNVSLEICNFLF